MCGYGVMMDSGVGGGRNWEGVESFCLYIF